VEKDGVPATNTKEKEKEKSEPPLKVRAFTCFTRVYLLYSHKSTDTDAAFPAISNILKSEPPL
jgi:hypothetical protein